MYNYKDNKKQASIPRLGPRVRLPNLTGSVPTIGYILAQSSNLYSSG